MVGANSVVSGTIPAYSMAVGFPARIVGRPPVFPKQLSDHEKTERFTSIVQNMIRFFVGSGLECEKQGDFYEIGERKGRWFRRRKWRMHVTAGDVRETVNTLGNERFDVFLSLKEIAADARDLLSSRNIVWIDVCKKERPNLSNDLSEEVLSFLKRYGIRTLRYPDIENPEPVERAPEVVGC